MTGWQPPRYDPRQHQQRAGAPQQQRPGSGPGWDDPSWPPPAPQPYRPQPQPAPAAPAPRAAKPKGSARTGCLLVVAVAAVIAIAVVALNRGSGSSPAAPPAASVSTQAAVASPGACKLKTTFDYIVRDNLPGASVQASEIGNVDLANCAPALSDFAATAGQASGECTTIALASDNPGYNVNEVPAPPLKEVIESAGPGC
jgi:hypothetical protein